MEKKPLILITNDDGITAKGIKNLVEAMRPLGTLVVVAPDKPQSGMGHAITIHDPIRLKKSNQFEGVEAYTCSGTPVDCVKIALYEILKERPALIVSGVNHGSNAATNILYSGTMSAAVEGAIEDIPSVGFSLLDFDANADFAAAAHYAHKIAKEVLKHSLPKNTCLNVNIPKGELTAVKGTKICRQGKAFWDDQFVKRQDPFGNDYYWISGEFSVTDHGEDTDMWALDHNYVSIVPTQFDMTAFGLISQLNEWDL
ncbi:5'/3'-nucleotidase SurE [Putridiphycobacter roseus]|uniref:5'-nucleotidase SurE n=1 Tax=Putridiphycobacter roseus TaxID=2219161 RepID=A0A2W1N160_9FLAO|nr:5'/3'-nucleotidase SurE [Putridiphycobacter roseus]PZE17280.1 5'/3'-nucleotidase SurE [Putridiphycobacter roseus]